MQSTRSERDGVRKRPRKIWSCLECRRKKLQCDHGLPSCGRCTRAGQAANCVYATVRPTVRPSANSSNSRDSTDVSPAHSLGQSGPLQSRTVDAELLSRLESVEERLWSLQSTQATSRARIADPAGQLPSPEGTNEEYDVIGPTLDPMHVVLRGSAFRTKFNGNTCAITLAEHIPELIMFKKDALSTFPAFDQIQQYLNKVEHRTTLTPMKPELSPDENLRQLLPSKEETDRHVAVYLDSFQHIYPVLYEPSFQEDYQQLWSGKPDGDTRFVVIVLIMVAISDCLTSTPFSTKALSATLGRSSDYVTPMSFGKAMTGQLYRSKATIILDTVELWVQSKVYSYEVILDFQISFLLLLGRQLNGKRSKRTWAHAGSMIRTFMCFGLHRDPRDLARETTAVDKMMRRRIWACAIDFELQSALEHGMPGESWSIHSDIGPPLNVNDDDSSNVLPPDTYTKSSFLIHSWKSLSLRHQLCSILNDMNGPILTHARAVSYTETLKQLHQATPKWTEPKSTAARTSLCITTHQYILAIHEQQLLAQTTNTEKQLSRLTLVDSATQILEAHREARESGSDVAELLYNDHVRAALAICHAYITADPLADRFLLSAMNATTPSIMESAIAIYSEKVMRFGGSKLDLWYICAADGLMKCFHSADNASQRSANIQKAVDHFTRPFYRLMAITKDPLDQQQQAEQTSSPFPRPDDTLMSSRLEDIQLPVFGEFGDWSFEDFSFDPNDFVDFQHSM